MNTMPTAVPAGFDAWLGNPGGKYVAPSFQIQGLTGLFPGVVPADPQEYCAGGKPTGGAPDAGCWLGTPANYSTAVIGNVSAAWISKVAHEQPDRPWFAYIAPKAAHEPFNPAPWYEGVWKDDWPEREPRPENWNCTAETRKNHAGVVATNPMITSDLAHRITDVFKNRWRTLMSVDDLIGDVITLCDVLGLSNNTYFFYSSDHGFQLGNFNVPWDKRHAYDWDTHIHLLARGPGIEPGSTWSEPATQVDVTATFLGLAGLPKPPNFDGKSLVPLIVSRGEVGGQKQQRGAAGAPTGPGMVLPESVAGHLRSMLDQLGGEDGSRESYAAGWRTSIFIEYYFVNDNNVCVHNCTNMTQDYPNKDASCGDLTPGANSDCWGHGTKMNAANPGCTLACVPTESSQNNFIALRSMPWSQHGNSLYVEYQAGSQYTTDVDFTKVDFVERFDVSQDPWHMHNLYNNTPLGNHSWQAAEVEALHAELHRWYNCYGDACP